MHSVAIVGRPNVGKSSLFNRLLGRRLSIVHDQPGVTRDRLRALCEKGSEPFEIIDTGGIGDAPDPFFSEATQRSAMEGINAADLLLFVVDGRAGVTPLDHQLALQLRQWGRPLFLVINKIDEESHESLMVDFYSLGFETVISLSAAHGRGISALLQTIDHYFSCSSISAPMDEEELKNSDPISVLNHLQVESTCEISEQSASSTVPKLAIVGRPNVGKSSLLNKIIGKERSIVSEIAGTTRDAIDTLCYLKGEPYLLVDTAGLRHRSKPDTSIEIFSAMRTEEALRRADVVLLVLDSTVSVTAQDKRIAGMIQQFFKPCLIILNKWDLIHKEDGGRASQGDYVAMLEKELFFLDYAPMICLSAKTGHEIGRLITMLQEVRKASQMRITTGELNRFFKAVWEHQPPPSRGGRRFKLLYATQVASQENFFFPIPEFLLFVNDEKLITDAYYKYLLRAIRSQWPFPGLPIRLRLQGRLSREEQDRKSGYKHSVSKKGEKTP